ncbi:MAG: cell wall-active antibiotics response protein [Idiomarinaceae bacterium HL-53]|nr:MAG: cell wall-active antibiotics response protein [Idiomarinaceae bacterium HL-53]CUS49349.1 Cell wall-active antibiotics response 4TMS YvqF [Idiomarinaceae bacterium HL-53]
MPVKLEDRPIEQVREETIDKLIVNYSHAVISAEAFERRLDQATESTSHTELLALVADLPMEADSHYDTYKDKQFTPHYRPGSDTTHQEITTILSNSERTGQWVVPREITVVGVLGATTLDFSDAIFQHQNITIRVRNTLSSLEILVPEAVNVTTAVTNIGSSSEHTAPNMAGKQAPLITVEGWSILSSVEVKLKKTMKEKFIAFANSIKETFSGKNLY